MKILFIAAKMHTIEPYGIMCLSPHLKAAGHSVRLYEAEDSALVDKVAEYEPQVIAYSVCTGSDRYYIALNRYLKQHLTFVSVFGGPHPTFFPEMIHEAGVDAICRGEGDHAFTDFCNALESSGYLVPVANFAIKQKGQVERCPPRPLIENLDALPFPDRDLYYTFSPEVSAHRVRSFLAARGCPFKCSYCFNPSMDALYEGTWHSPRIRSVGSLVDEIEGVAKKHATEFVAFRESIFPLKLAWLEEFAREYPARVGVPFYCHLRLDLLNKENVALLAKAGCHSVNVGIETGNEEIRRTLLGRNMTNETMINACRLLRQHGIKILANNMLGLPGGTLENDIETLKLNQRCKPDYALAMLWQPYPGTGLAKYAIANGHYKGDGTDLDFTYYDHSHLEFRSAKEKRRIENLQKLFAPAVALPSLTPLVKLMTHLPSNPIFKAIFGTMYLIVHQTDIFPHKMTLSEWGLNLRHIAKEA
ncbi:MAG: B12-binding domain-containing radical SAM protein [Verrucomicrobia bacterium]|jgi:anaerobic magnesium-protoporphyrin IX monomethyl ester cyclase|nr:B12-binding domain-containing radical SAM protein [Verrucomicrobiota bacterium]MBT7068471.1 B12-binding domain-containing radical SAM protein [Verrucomicrobiota bacterium]